jgi:LL-diaminopimelate aminotransferase
MITKASRLDGVNEYYFSTKLREIEKMRSEGKPVINLGIGSPDLPPHEDVVTTLNTQASQKNTHAYQSYKGSQALREAMANFYKTNYGVGLDATTEILPLIGSKEGIMHICMTYFEKGDSVLIPNPGYPTYSSAVNLCGATAIPYQLTEANNWQIAINEIELLIATHKNIKGIFINSPHMPTGSLLDDSIAAALIALCITHNILIIHDNPYSFILNENPKSLLALPRAKEILIELNSLSKSHNMAGWRIGMLCGAAHFINDVLQFKSNMDSGMFLPLQLAAAEALALPKNWFATINTIYAERKQIALKILNAVGASYTQNQVGMFVWAKANNYESGYALSDKILYEHNVFITPGGIFGSNGNDYVRISLCSTVAQLNEALERIKKD